MEEEKKCASCGGELCPDCGGCKKCGSCTCEAIEESAGAEAEEESSDE